MRDELWSSRRRLRGHAARAAHARLLGPNGESIVQGFRQARREAAGATAGVKLYLLPFRDRIYFELRRPAAEADPGRKFAWRFKDWAVYTALPEAARSLGMAVPIRQIRYPLIDSLSEVAQRLVNNALVRSGSNSVEQSGRYRMLGSKSRFTYTTWAFPAGEFANTALAYKLFCKEYYARTGFRCDMPTVGFRLNRDRSALLSPSFDSPMFTLSPLSTQDEGWDDFVLDFADFAAKHHGVPFFNQTRNASPEVVAQRFGTRLAFFNKVRRELDPLRPPRQPILPDLPPASAVTSPLPGARLHE